MPGIISDTDIAALGDSIEAVQLRNAFEKFITHHREIQKALVQSREDGKTLARVVFAYCAMKLTPEEEHALMRCAGKEKP